MRSGWPAGSQEKNSAEAVESVLLACGRGGKQARPLYGLAIGLDGRLREPATAAFPLTGHCGSRNATEAHYAQVACRNSRDVLSKRWIHWALARWQGVAAVYGAFAGTDRRVSYHRALPQSRRDRSALCVRCMPKFAGCFVNVLDSGTSGMASPPCMERLREPAAAFPTNRALSQSRHDRSALCAGHMSRCAKRSVKALDSGAQTPCCGKCGDGWFPPNKARPWERAGHQRIVLWRRTNGMRGVSAGVERRDGQIAGRRYTTAMKKEEQRIQARRPYGGIPAAPRRNAGRTNRPTEWREQRCRKDRRN